MMDDMRRLLHALYHSMAALAAPAIAPQASGTSDRELREYIAEIKKELAHWLVLCDTEDVEATAAESLAIPKKKSTNKSTFVDGTVSSVSSSSLSLSSSMNDSITGGNGSVDDNDVSLTDAQRRRLYYADIRRDLVSSFDIESYSRQRLTPDSELQSLAIDEYSIVMKLGGLLVTLSGQRSTIATDRLAPLLIGKGLVRPDAPAATVAAFKITPQLEMDEIATQLNNIRIWPNNRYSSWYEAERYYEDGRVMGSNLKLTIQHDPDLDVDIDIDDDDHHHYHDSGNGNGNGNTDDDKKDDMKPILVHEKIAGRQSTHIERGAWMEYSGLLPLRDYYRSSKDGSNHITDENKRPFINVFDQMQQSMIHHINNDVISVHTMNRVMQLFDLPVTPMNCRLLSILGRFISFNDMFTAIYGCATQWNMLPSSISRRDRSLHQRSDEVYEPLRSLLRYHLPLSAPALQLLVLTYVNEAEIRDATDTYERERATSRGGRNGGRAGGRGGRSGRGKGKGASKGKKQTKPSIIKS